MILLHVWKAIDHTVHMPLSFFCKNFCCKLRNFIFKKFWAVFIMIIDFTPCLKLLACLGKIKAENHIK